MLATHFKGQECAAVVKADAYGLGALPIAQALEAAGCHTFFVATLPEAIALRNTLPDVRILVLHGVGQGEEFAFTAHRLIPVLNSEAQLARWIPVARDHIHAVSALHLDTAMGRMGLEPEAFTALLARTPTVLAEARVSLLMSHLACASEPQHPSNAAQLALFQTVCQQAPGIPASLCNSSGIFLPRDYHFHLARPGCALYGIQPNPQKPDARLAHVATWHAPILMTRTLTRTQAVGYGATQTLPQGTRIATVASGYADGYLRLLSGRAVGYVGSHRVPLVGRVTMDMLCFDVSDVPEPLLTEGAPLTLLGDQDGIRVDDLADATETIGYEILSRIGPRVHRLYAE